MSVGRAAWRLVEEQCIASLYSLKFTAQADRFCWYGITEKGQDLFFNHLHI